jgi:hypothetical protein
MCAYHVGPTYHVPNNMSTIQQPTRLKNSVNNSFEQNLKSEINKADQKNNVKAQQNSQALNNINAKASLKTSKNFLAPVQPGDANGTNLALKELSTELAEQIVGILFNYAMNPDGTLEGGFAETVYSQEANAEKVKGAAKDLIDDLSEQFYEESLRTYELNKNDEVVTQQTYKEQ